MGGNNCLSFGGELFVNLGSIVVGRLDDYVYLINYLCSLDME